MKKILLILFLIGLCFNITYSQGSTCASPITLANGGCLTNQTFPGSVNMAGLCVGGSNPALYIRFVAGSCSQFTFTSNGNVSVIGSQFLNSDCSQIAGTIDCDENVVNGRTFSISGVNSTGTNFLTPGTTYVLRLWGPIGTTRFSICYNANTSEQPSNECSRPITLGTSTQSFYNGGDCSFSGSYDDATTSDQAPSTMCAGSLENTQWVRFTPQAGVSSFEVRGTNISCTGGGCGFQFGIFSGPCTSLTSEGCYGNKVCSGGQSTAGPTNVSGGLANISWSNTTTSSFTATFTPTIGSTFTGTEVFYLVMDGNGDADCNYDLLGVNLVTFLAIELNSFETKYLENEKSVSIKWSTNSETDNYSFVIERSFNGLDYVSIGSVDGAINSNELKYYEYKDNPTIGGFIYYRLKWIDDNNVNYSNISVVDIKHNDKISINIVKNELVIQNNDSFFNVTIINNVGQLILSKNNIRSNVEKINIEDLPIGIYIITIENEMGVRTERFGKI